jgi:hypothetical protein
MAQVGRLKQHQTKFGQSRFVTATQLECHVWTASGVEMKFVSEVLKKYGVCVCVWSKIIISDTTVPRHNSTNLESEISCAYIGSETET